MMKLLRSSFFPNEAGKLSNQIENRSTTADYFESREWRNNRRVQAGRVEPIHAIGPAGGGHSAALREGSSALFHSIVVRERHFRWIAVKAWLTAACILLLGVLGRMLVTFCLMLAVLTITNCQASESAASAGGQTLIARVTVYARNEPGGDRWTRQRQSSTGVRLSCKRHCAVDPRVIPYGSTVIVPGIGKLKAVDTGSAVVSRRAARLLGRNVPVIDVYFDRWQDAQRFASTTPPFVTVQVW